VYIFVCVYACACVKACRGDMLNRGMEIAQDSGEEGGDAIPTPPQRIPIEADFLYAYSTTPGLCLRIIVTTATATILK